MVGKANGSRECAPDDKLRVPTIVKQNGGHGASARFARAKGRPAGHSGPNRPFEAQAAWLIGCACIFTVVLLARLPAMLTVTGSIRLYQLLF
jgi:hypothetical protein